MRQSQASPRRSRHATPPNSPVRALISSILGNRPQAASSRPCKDQDHYPERHWCLFQRQQPPRSETRPALSRPASTVVIFHTN